MLDVLIHMDAGSDKGTRHPTMKVRKRLLKQLTEEASMNVAVVNQM